MRRQPTRGSRGPRRAPVQPRRRRNNSAMSNMVGSATGAYIGTKMAQGGNKKQYVQPQPVQQQVYDENGNPIPQAQYTRPHTQPQGKGKGMGILGIIAIIVVIWILYNIMFPAY